MRISSFTVAVVARPVVTVSPVNLIRRIEAGHGGFLLFALTPPRLATEPERVREIAAVTTGRLRPLGLDGLILYDIADEAERNPAERPFPFMPTLDPADYLADHLDTWPTPVIVYRAVGDANVARRRPGAASGRQRGAQAGRRRDPRAPQPARG